MEMRNIFNDYDGNEYENYMHLVPTSTIDPLSTDIEDMDMALNWLDGDSDTDLNKMEDDDNMSLIDYALNKVNDLFDRYNINRNDQTIDKMDGNNDGLFNSLYNSINSRYKAINYDYYEPDSYSDGVYLDTNYVDNDNDNDYDDYIYDDNDNDDDTDNYEEEDHEEQIQNL